MRKIVFIVLQILCFTAAIAKSQPWKANDETVPARPDLDVRWQDSTKFPREVWVYDLSPNRFSPEIISNLMALCSFSETNKVEDDANGVVFRTTGRPRMLSVSFSSGEIQYDMPERRYSRTNLTLGVPPISDLPALATNLLHQLHISFSDITGYFGTNNIEYLEPAMTMFYVGDKVITNIPYRTILFKRRVDGMPVAHRNCRFNVGPHGEIEKIEIAWPNVKRVQSYQSVSPTDVIRSLREGRAVRGPVPTNVGDLDWASVKSLTIKRAVPSYLMDGGRLYPFLHLDGIVDTGQGTVEIGMGCAIFDESNR